MKVKQIYASFRKIIISTQILLFLIIAYSIIPRLLKLISHEDYYTDSAVGSYLLHVKSIVFDHQLQLLGQQAQNTGFAQGAGVYYLLGIPITFMNGDPYGAQVFMFVISLLIVILCPLLLWRIYGRKEALFIGIFLGISPYLNYHTVSLWPPYVVPLLVALYLIFFLCLQVKVNRKYYIFMSIALGLIPHFEVASFALILPSYLLLSLYLIYIKLIKRSDLLLAGGVFFFLFLPHIIFDLTHNFYNLKGLIAVLPFGQTKTVTLDIFANFIDRRHLIKTDLIAVFPPVPINFLYIFLLILLIGSYMYIKDRSNKKWKKIFIINLFTTITLSNITLMIFPFSKAEIWWIPYFSIIYIFITGIILSYFWDQKSLLYKVFILLFLFLFIRAEIEEISLRINNEQSFKNQKYLIRMQEPIEYIYADSKNKPFKILYLTESTYVLDFKYLFWYIGKTKYPNSEGFKNLDLNYILPGGPAVALDKHGQFKNLSPGIYYLIITQQSIENGYASQFLNKPIGELLSSKSLSNTYVVQKRYVQ